MRARYAEMIAAVRSYSATTTIPGMAHIMGNTAEFLATLAEDAEKQTAENLALQRKLLSLTRVLAWLTGALFVLTAYLCFDSYQLHRRATETQKNTPEQHDTNSDVTPKT